MDLIGFGMKTSGPDEHDDENENDFPEDVKR